MRLNRSTPLATLAKQPEIAVLLERHHIRKRDIDELHVLFIQDTPNDHGRAVEQAVFLRKPVELEVRTIGSGIKSLDDEPCDEIGLRIAMGRGLRRIGRHDEG